MLRITICVFLWSFISFYNHAQTVTDVDGHIYNTVTIGTQTWFKENLKTTHFRNGTPIPNVTNDSDWDSITYGARCYYNNDSTAFANEYGAIYNWYVINFTDSVCPIGWRVPKIYDWDILVNDLGGDDVAGGKLKEAGLSHWLAPNTGATNESFFTALPGGARSSDFYGMGYNGYWWSSTLAHIHFNWFWTPIMSYNSTGCITNASATRNHGAYIRCVKDTLTGINEFNYEDEVLIYPNPIGDRLKFFNTGKQNYKIQIFNVFGECLLQIDFNSIYSEIDVCNLPSGIYILNITRNNTSFRKKIVKE